MPQVVVDLGMAVLESHNFGHHFLMGVLLSFFQRGVTDMDASTAFFR